MNVTQRLLFLDPTLELHNEGEWSGGEEARLFSAFNSGGIECETGEFLYGLVRLLKPERVLETGTHLGVGASYMGMALEDNKRGMLDTVEFLQEIYDQARIRIEKMGLLGRVQLHFGDVAKFEPKRYLMAGNYGPLERERKYQLILLDTEPQTRFAEFIKFYPYLDSGGFVFIHDLHRHMAQVTKDHPDHLGEPYWPWGALPQQIKDWVKEDKLRPFHFSTPRGLTGFYKPHEGDYKWS